MTKTSHKAQMIFQLKFSLTMTNFRKSSKNVPGDELLKSYYAWKRKLPELQRLITDPKWSRSEVVQFSKRIDNLKQGIETFEKLHPKHAVKDAYNSKVIQNAGVQAELFG
jgi:hypothetical protein